MAMGILASVAACIAVGSTTTLPLRNGVIDTPPMTEAAVTAALVEVSTRSDDGHAIVVLQPGYSPAQLRVEGIDLQASLGGRAWVANILPQAADSEIAQGAVQWMSAFKPIWKLHPYLAKGGVPDWTIDQSATEALLDGRAFQVEQLLREFDAVADPRVILYLLAHRDADLDLLASDLPVLASAKVYSHLESVHGLVVEMPISAIEPLADDGRILWIEPALPKFAELNDQNRDTSEADIVQDAPYGLDGEGVVVMVYDGGYALESHGDFGGRLTVRDSAGLSDHATHVSGTIGGDGSGSGGQYAGMAPGVTIESYGFEQEGGLQEGFLYTDPGDLEADYGDAINNYGAVIANNSIGTNTAPNGFPCEWTGDYGITSSVIDAVVRGSLGGDIRIMWANGNERQTDRCGSLYYTTAPPACAKNHITVGALNSNDESVTSFTSWGPADDGRIKPDISTAGCQSDGDGGVTSCSSSGGYSTKCGTSMSSPTACGIGALIIQDWRAQYPGKADLANATLKAMLAHTAADLGNPGPDCQYGYGSIRAQEAIEHLRGGSLIEAEVSDGESFEFLVIVQPGDPQLQVTLAWDDEPATPLVIPSLVNDLDLVVLAPDGTRRYPWAIDPSDPGAPATQVAEDHLNNIEQVTVNAPDAGVWRVQVQGYAVPVGPQGFGVMATPDLVACSSTGIVGLDRGVYPLEGSLGLTVVDCDLNTSDTIIDIVDVWVTSTLEPAGEWITLIEEDAAASTFSGSMPHSTTDAVGTLLVGDGAEVQVLYVDAEDADGNVDVDVLAIATVDGVPANLIDVSIGTVEPRDATIHVEANEQVTVYVDWGTSCGALDETDSAAGPGPSYTVSIGGLTDETTYYFKLRLVDAAGNLSAFDDGGDCWSFTTPDIPDFFTEQFGSGFDLEGWSVRFEPSGGVDRYVACAVPITDLPVDPSGGTSISLGDDDFEAVTPSQPVMLYDETYGSVYVGSNGYLTFDGGDTSYSESLSAHFQEPRISAIWDDLNPSVGGTVSWKNTSLGLAVTWENVPEYGSSNANTFQVIMEWDGTIQMSWLTIELGDGIVGLSAGGGQDPDWFPSDLSELQSACGPQPPHAGNQSLSTPPGVPVEITLTGTDDGLPDPPGMLTFILDSLPTQPLRDLATGQVITSLPYAFTGGEAPVVRYEPQGNWEGYDEFIYHVDDGGSAPDGGPSDPGLIGIVVSSGPQLIHEWNMDNDPGWSMDGDWAWGIPQGSGGQYGNPDPTSGATGDHVIGFNLAGDYGNNLSELYLSTNSIDCSELTDVELRFQRWLNVEQPAYDHAYVRVSLDGGSWQTLWENTSEITDSSWNEQIIDLSIADGISDVRVAWVQGTTDSSWQYSGWNIDDVQIVAISTASDVPGDANGDGIVNADDILLVISAWGPCPPGDCDGDLNGDGVVNTDDLLMVIAGWSQGGMPRSLGEDEQAELTVDASDDVRPVFVNADRLSPVDLGGLVSFGGDYIQLPGAVLVMDVFGPVPVQDHDLMVFDGVATLDGQLIVRLNDTPIESGAYPLVVASRIDGDFSRIVIEDPLDRDAWICVGPRSVTLVVSPAGDAFGEAPAANVIRAVLRSIGTSDRQWDLDGDNMVTEVDLGVMLDGWGACLDD
ncbi:MAG: S8 family serine peptidase [Phycisphaerales bacterium]|nr:S8 family serine peptidase [Phycisphaerales bacterium]